MHRTPRRTLVATALLSLLAPLTLAIAVPTARAARDAAAPELRLSAVPAGGNPLEVDRYDPEAPPARTDILLNVSTDAPVSDVTVTVVLSNGLYVDPLVTHIDTLDPTSAEVVDYAVAARTPGVHNLTLEVTAPGVRTKRYSMPYIWSPGGPPIDGDDSLAGQLYGRNGFGSYPCTPSARCDFRTSDRVVFLDDHRTSPALAVNGAQRCPRARRCPTYHHDQETGLVQIGRGTIGRVTPRATFIDGERYTRLAYPRRGQRLNGLWQYGADVDEGRGVVEQRLDLRTNGRFRLSYGVDTHRYPETGLDTAYSRAFRGRYVIGRHGRIALKDPRRRTVVATLALAVNGFGRPRAGRTGVWLDLRIDPPDGEPFVDGNLLSPLPRSVG